MAVLASGRGSNFQAIIDAIKAGKLHAEVKVLITDNKKAPVIERATNAGIPVKLIEQEKFKTREEMDLEIKKTLDSLHIDLVLLAGYMRLLKAKELFEEYRNKIINIHPSLLPAFPGIDAQKQAFEYGVKITGITIHFVDEQLDHGPIIHQRAIDIRNCKTAEQTAKKILSYEHKAYIAIIDQFTKGTYKIEDRKVVFIPYTAVINKSKIR